MPQARSRQYAQGKYVRLTVCNAQDTGSGIGEEDLKKIYESFFNTKVFLKGIGLGLPLTKTILDDHDGFIRVTSAVEASFKRCVRKILPRFRRVIYPPFHKDANGVRRSGIEQIFFRCHISHLFHVEVAASINDSD
ncbi:MAG TPA: ATP-binding protein [Nitrospirota bacterium]|nr:ATP-binding protein [Nitrospirota bacterium]